ncbi:MAG: hypothetical protein ACRCST_03045 [Turicibacter sp.]
MKAIDHINNVLPSILQTKSELTQAITLTQNPVNKIMLQKSISSLELIYQNLHAFKD